MQASPAVFMERPHVVLLGAGASRAAHEAGDVDGGALPVMDDLVTVTGLASELDQLGIEYRGRNFEELYGELCDQPSLQPHRQRIEARLREYFLRLHLVRRPTLYDHLVLSLREKDVIATFNWDSLLFDACARNWRHTKLPHVLYLHGNVRIGYCETDWKQGPIAEPCSVCGRARTPVPLLFPVARKDYASDPYIRTSWDLVRNALRSAFVVTIFGYSGPESDAEAIRVMEEAWGEPDVRELEQVEIIDLKDEEELRRKWSRFICSHHYQTTRTFYESLIAQHPRRTCEAVWNQTQEGIEQAPTPVPRNLDFKRFHDWYARLRTDEE